MDKEIFENGTINAGEHTSEGIRFFDENFLHPKATALDGPKFIEFDFEVLRRSLGEMREELGEEGYALLGEALGSILQWIVKDTLSSTNRKDRRKSLESVALRALAIAWTVNPNLLGGVSAAKLARLLGFSKWGFARVTSQMSRKFSVTNRSQCHGWNRKSSPDAR
jgi:hypothetical protein